MTAPKLGLDVDEELFLRFEPVGRVEMAAPCQRLASVARGTAVRSDLPWTPDSVHMIDIIGRSRLLASVHRLNSVRGVALRLPWWPSTITVRDIKHTGDGVLGSFSDASAAVTCAQNIQRAFAAHRQAHPVAGARRSGSSRAVPPISKASKNALSSTPSIGRARARPSIARTDQWPAPKGSTHELPSMSTADMAGRRMPRIRGESLSRVEYEFPRDLDRAATLFLVAFYQRQQPAVNTWLPTAAELAAHQAHFSFFEIPLIGRRYRPGKALINGGMRSGIADPKVRATTVTAFQSVTRFLRALGIADRSEIVVLLVDRTGIIHWSTRGPLSDPATGGELRAAVRELVVGPGTAGTAR